MRQRSPFIIVREGEREAGLGPGPRAHDHALRRSPFAALAHSGDRTDPPSTTTTRSGRSNERSQAPFVIALVFILVLGLVVFMASAGKSRAHEKTATTTLTRGCRYQRRQRTLLFVLIFVFVLDTVVTGPAGKRDTHQQTATLATAQSCRKEETAKMMFVVIIFVLVLDVVAFTSFAGESQAHQQTAAATAAYRCREQKAAKLPLIVVIVFVLVLDVDVVVFAASARERSQPDHATASTAAAQSCRERELSSTRLFQTINILVSVLGHCPSLSWLGCWAHGELVPPLPARIAPAFIACSPTGLRSRAMRSSISQLDQSPTRGRDQFRVALRACVARTAKASFEFRVVGEGASGKRAMRFSEWERNAERIVS